MHSLLSLRALTGRMGAFEHMLSFPYTMLSLSFFPSLPHSHPPSLSLMKTVPHKIVLKIISCSIALWATVSFEQTIKEVQEIHTNCAHKVMHNRANSTCSKVLRSDLNHDKLTAHFNLINLMYRANPTATTAHKQ